MSQQHETDVVIIGAGPVGLFAVFELGMLKIRAHVVDALDMLGGQCAALYPEKPIYDIPAHPAIDAQDLIEKLKEQAAPFKPVYHLGKQVISVSRIQNSEFGSATGVAPALSGERSEQSIAEVSKPEQGQTKTTQGHYKITTNKSTTITCKAIIIAAGCGAFGPNRPPLAGLEAYEGTSVFYMVARKEDYRGKRIVIAGGGDSAVDWAVALAPIAQQIYMVHRRDKFRAAPETVDKMNQLAAEGKIELVTPYQLERLEGANGQLSGVVVKHMDGAERTLAADVLLPFFGLAMELGPIANWGLNLHKNLIAVEPTTCATSEAGIFAIGDIATYPHKLKLILCGFSEAAMAAHAIYPLIHPDVALHFEYSTSKGVK